MVFKGTISFVILTNKLSLVQQILPTFGTGNCNTTEQKIKFSIKYIFSKCGQIRRKLQIWSYLLKKSLMENVIFCEVSVSS